MVEPLEFETTEINEVHKNDIYKIKINENNKKDTAITYIADVDTQTPMKPALQKANH
jgi:hypothetical protein